MKEYWVNVYYFGLGIKHKYKKAAVDFGNACLPAPLYRIHVKMKEPWQYKREYEYKFNFDQLIYSETRGRYDTYDYFKVKGIKHRPTMTTKPNKHWMDN